MSRPFRCSVPTWKVTAFSLTPLLVISGCDCGEIPQQVKNPDPCTLALAAHEGDTRIDQQIRLLQEKAGTANDAAPLLERIGWLFVSKARSESDTGYFKLAEQASLCMDAKQPRSPAGLLLHGHALHNLHRFQEAERVARELLEIRRAPFDYGLLGDVLMEQGQLEEAAEAYQKMADLKPGLHSYLRVAHMRWLKGDLEGAIPIMRMAARASSPRDTESAAWVYARLALLEMQAGNLEKALRATKVALGYQADYAPALLARGRVLLAEGRNAEAADALRAAATQNRLPEYQWLLADSLRLLDAAEEAGRAEEQIESRGAVEDPRTTALYLATRGEQIQDALRFARQELESRKDIFTLDAIAWALHSGGRTQEAAPYMKRALAEGTQDARLYFHAAAIAAAGGRKREARVWAEKAEPIRQMLFPSEREQFASLRMQLGMTTNSM